MESKVVGFIDLGTNSARLLVIRLNENYSYNVLTRQKEVVRLGEGEFEQNVLHPEAIGRAIVVLTKFASIARNFGAEEIITAATSATRDARNRNDLIRRLQESADLDLNVISGEEEARLIWLGISSGIEIDGNKAFFIDIGGGSTESIIGDQSSPYLLRSLRLGAIRTTNQYIPPDLTGPVPDPILSDIRREVRNEATYLIRESKKYKITAAYGSSGTIIALESVATGYRDHIPGILKTQELEEIIQKLSSLSLKNRRTVPGLNPDRADIIIAGAIILHEIMKGIGISAISISDRSLRDGLLVDYLSKIPGFPHGEDISVRRKSVRQLGRSCHIDEKHAGQVVKLVLDLYDSAKRCRLHDLNPGFRELLEYAAYLHDIGQFISFSGHHQHSFYVITHAPLLGFNQNELLLIGLITRYHRKRMPRPRDRDYRRLTGSEKKALKILTTFLRIAENLDRGHDGRIDSARYICREKKKVYLEITCTGDCSLECWAVRHDLQVLERVGPLPDVEIIQRSPELSPR